MRIIPSGPPDSPSKLKKLKSQDTRKEGIKSPKKTVEADKSAEQKAKEEDNMPKKKERERWKVLTDKFLNFWPVTTFMTVITIYALFADDLRVLFFEKPNDYIFYTVTSISLFFFLELVLASLATDKYFLGFYFWLDLVATLSLITDIAWIYDPIVGTQGIEAGNAEQAGNVARAGRSARIGTRASRIARVIRLIRLIRVVKLYKNAQAAMLREQLRKEEELEAIAREEADELELA